MTVSSKNNVIRTQVPTVKYKCDNITDLRNGKVRRLIPYMKYYIPTNRYESQTNHRQDYNIIVIGNQKSEYDQYVKAQNDEKDIEYKPTKNQDEYQIYNYQLYPERHNIGHSTANRQESKIQQVKVVHQVQHQINSDAYKNSPNSYTDQNDENVPILKSSNKSPGLFRSMYVDKNEFNYPYQIKEQASVTAKPNQQAIYKTTQRYFVI